MRLYDYPLSEEFSSFIATTRGRIDDIIDRLKRLREMLLEENTLASIRQVEIAARISRLEYELQALQAKDAVGNLLIIHEPFVDNRSCDTAALTKEEAEVVPAYGMLTLKRRTSRELGVAAVRVLAGNGLPGNIHQVYPETRLYHARDGLHADLRYIVDGNSDTWFEYESLSGLPGHRYQDTAFADSLHWLQFNVKNLLLELELELSDLDVVGGLVVDPFVPSAAGYRSPYLAGLMLDDGRGTRQQLKGAPMDRARFIACLPQLARKVRASIKQDTPYYTWVGIPQKPYPVSVIGMKYDPFTGQVIQPEYRAGDGRPDEGALIEEFFSEPALEAVPALRFHIGLRQLSLLAHTYEKESEYISRPYQVPAGIRSIQIDVGSVVPDALSREGLVKVSISTDDGATWHYIGGSNEDAVAYDLPRKVIFGTYMPDFLKEPRTLYLDKTPDNFRVRIELARPHDLELSEYITPIVTEYTAVVEQAGGDN